MNKIEMRGVFVPSNYDVDWAESYIQRGLILPESRFRKALAAASVKEPLEIYINSPGGSVFVGNEMANAVQQWKATASQPVTITLGALAASAAAVFSVAAGDKVRAHKNSMMMFHGAWSVVEGGAGAMKDEAELLAKINGAIKATLVTKYNLPPERVEEWFAEGRMGWLTAAELKEAGIVGEIIGGDAEKIEFPKEDVANITQRGLAIAAMLPPEAAAEEPGAIETAATTATEAETTMVTVTPASIVLTSETYSTGTVSQDSEFLQMCAAIDTLKAQLEEKEEARRAEQSAKDKALAALATERKQWETASATAAEESRKQKEKYEAEMSELRSRHSRLLVGSLKFSPSVDTWADAVRACGGDVTAAKKQYADKWAVESAERKGSQTVGWRAR